METNIYAIIENVISYGGKKLIAERAGVSYPTVIRCFKGKSKNEKVLNAAIEIYKEIGAKQNSIKKIIISTFNETV